MSQIKVEYIDHFGSDLSVVNAARVSFAKESDLVFGGLDEEGDEVWVLDDKDVKLIYYLAKHKHTSPFGHAFASFRVKAPVFVARQLVKHKFLRWNETSRRYVDDEPEMFMPNKWRARADNVKQGSSEESVLTIPFVSSEFGIKGLELIDQAVGDLYSRAQYLYQRLLDGGVAPEQARAVLPQAMMTEWVWSGSLDAFASMCKLRLDPHTQYESRLVAQEISTYMSKLFPHSWESLLKYG